MFRLPPAGRPGDYRTFRVSAPLATHWRKATCEEAQCAHFLNGWVTKCVTAEQMEYIRSLSGRVFEEREPGVFYFAPGQTCFRNDTHRVPVEREAIYTEFVGDHRHTLSAPRRYDRAEQWVAEFAEHQEKLRAQQERG